MLFAPSTFFFFFCLASQDKAVHGNDRASTTCISYSLAASVESALTNIPLLSPSVILYYYLQGCHLMPFIFLLQNESYIGTLLLTFIDSIILNLPYILLRIIMLFRLATNGECRMGQPVPFSQLIIEEIIQLQV